MIEATSKYLHFNAIFSSNSQFLFCGENLATNQSWKQRLLVESVYFRHICHTRLELFHEMSQVDDCDCAMFVSQHCAANIKASAQGSSWKFKKVLSRNQVEAPAKNVDEARDKYFKHLTGVILIESHRGNDDSVNWRLSENITNLTQLKNCKLRPLVKTNVFNISFCLLRTEDSPST